MTRDRYLQCRRENTFTVQELFDFYQEAEHHHPKIDLNTFQQAIPHYISAGGSLEMVFRKYDALFEILHIKNGEKGSLIV